MRNKLPILLGVALLVVTAITVAQTEQPETSPAPNDYGVMRLWSNLGSYMLEGEGTVEISFTGTLLVSNLNGTIEVTGHVRKEYDALGRQAWFGTGNAVIRGSWRRVQWFGSNMQTRWHGAGLALVFGEYDLSGEDTGRVQVDDLPEQPWYTVGMEHIVPAKNDPLYEVRKDLGSPQGPQQAPPTMHDDHDHDHDGHSH